MNAATARQVTPRKSPTPIMEKFWEAHSVYQARILQEAPTVKRIYPSIQQQAIATMKRMVELDLVFPTSPAPRVLREAIGAGDEVPSCRVALERLYAIRHGEQS